MDENALSSAARTPRHNQWQSLRKQTRGDTDVAALLPIMPKNSRLYSMFDRILTTLFGSKNERDVKTLVPIVAKINQKEDWAAALSDDGIKEASAALRAQVVAAGDDFENELQKVLPEAFALVRECAKRVLGERHYDVQLMGSLVLHSGRIVEMKTGEGKTLMCVAAAYLNALTGRGVHIVTVNDYLAERDANWMRPVYEALGCTVGIIVSSMDNDARRKAYACDITYGTNNELGFDYLRDNMQVDIAQKVQRSFTFCIVDEIDSILIDEARTPLIISGAGEDDTARYYEVDKYVGLLEEAEKTEQGFYPDESQGEEVYGDYKIDEKSRRISFTNNGLLKMEEILKKHQLIAQDSNISDEENFEYTHYFTQAVRAHVLYKPDVDYIVRDGQVVIIDEFTGRPMDGRRYGDGLHQAIEAKEHIKIAQRNRTLATITFQNFFRMYKKLAGMTGTAETEAVEFDKIYHLEVTVIPTNKPVARIDANDEVYLNEKDKWDAICFEIQQAHARGQPVLVGTVSIEKSELLSSLLTKRGIRHEVLNAKNHAREALIIAEAGAKGSVTIATNMAGRGTDIKLGGNPEFRARKKAGTEASAEQYEAAYKSEKEKWLVEFEEVKTAGGLYVIGTERHESRRIDNQLRGRSGRQGDPGRSKFYISMDDSLMRLFGGEKMKAIMTRAGMEPGEPIEHPWLNKGIEKAQKKVEERNFEIRKHLLEYDDVLNEQRNYIYSQRDAILVDADLSERVLSSANDYLEDYAEELGLNSTHASKKSGAGLQEFCANTASRFDIKLVADEIAKQTAEGSELIPLVLEKLRQNIADKETIVTKENFNMFIRYQYIQFIDKKWLDHLESLEALRESVYLRSYGSKNPLTEYKLDGFNMFDDMIESIRNEIAGRIARVRIKVDNDPKMRQRFPMATVALHNEAASFTGSKGADPMARGRQAEHVTVVRTMPKVGRNDPCPCGSGKKYKYCHGV
ncbi:MAG: preprotein translocase subunit SecA [Treponemataceae bacterium]|nr:MAG: preprotein translocase subunit SecA [Treponemataceae bacterium]